MKYKNGDIEVEGTPEEIYAFLGLKIGKEKKEPKAKNPVLSRAMRKAWKRRRKDKGVTMSVNVSELVSDDGIQKVRKKRRFHVRKHHGVNYRQFFGGKPLISVFDEHKLGERPLKKALEALHALGLPRTSPKLIKRVKGFYWAYKSAKGLSTPRTW